MRKFIFNPEKHFLGKSCKNGHKGYRFKSSPGQCCECHSDRSSYNKTYNHNRNFNPKRLAVRLFLGCKNRQKKKNPNAPFDITVEWIEQKINHGYCEVTKLPFNLIFSDTIRRPFAPSVDKKNPNGFYTKDNCQIVCFIYNVAKNQFTHDNVITLAKAILNNT